MSLQYIIDGNNLLHTGGKWDEIPWANRRGKLLEYLESERPTGSVRNSITVVFDGHSPRLRLTGPQSILVVFSGDEDADTVIKDRVGQLSNPRTSVVVTNDKSIRLYVRKKGAKVLSCEEFFLLGRKKTQARSMDGLDISSANQINDEFKSIWKLN